MNTADDDVRPVARAIVQLGRHRTSQLLCVRVKGKCSLLAVRQLLRLLAATVRRGQNDGQVARPVFDVLVAAEINLARLIVGASRNSYAYRKPCQARQAQSIECKHRIYRSL